MAEERAYMNTFWAIVIMIFTCLCTANPVRAAEIMESDASARTHTEKTPDDHRADMLKEYLQSRHSPLADDAHTFVTEADRLDLDWKLVAAISGVEATCGRHIPHGSHNAWGWGIPTGARHGVAFESWSEGITTVSEGLKYRYINRGATTIQAIGRIYAASPAWSTKVRWMIADIDAFITRSTQTLAVTI